MWFDDAREAILGGRDACRADWGFDTWLRQAPDKGLVAISGTTGQLMNREVLLTWKDVCATDWAVRTSLRLEHSIVDHPAWEHVIRYFVGRPTELRGLDVRNLGLGFSMWLQDIQIACCRCAHPIRPFRRRRGDAHENLFFSPACPNDINPGCSRAHECRDEIDRIRAHAHDKAPPPSAQQLGLF